MSSLRSILVTPDPQGKFLEGTLSSNANGAKPGAAMMIDTTKSEVAGRPQYTYFANGANGARGLMAILLEDELFGGTVDDAFSTNDRIRMYCPGEGDELLVRFLNVGTGTGAGEEDIALGDLLITDYDGSGNFIVTTGSPEREAFEAMEAISNITADKLVLVRYTGS